MSNRKVIEIDNIDYGDTSEWTSPRWSNGELSVRVECFYSKRKDQFSAEIIECDLLLIDQDGGVLKEIWGSNVDISATLERRIVEMAEELYFNRRL